MPRAPNQIKVVLKEPAALFDDGRTASFPHTGRMLDESLGDYLESRARLEPKAPSIVLEVSVTGAPSPSAVEEQARADLRHYYECERQISRLDEDVNRVEGIRSFTHTVPVLLGAGVIALLVYILVHVTPPATLVGAFLAAFVYLALITVVWVLFWDPFEKVVFDAFMLRSRTAALDKLMAATVRFTYSAPGPSTPGSPA